MLGCCEVPNNPFRRVVVLENEMRVRPTPEQNFEGVRVRVAACRFRQVHLNAHTKVRHERQENPREWSVLHDVRSKRTAQVHSGVDVDMITDEAVDDVQGGVEPGVTRPVFVGAAGQLHTPLDERELARQLQAIFDLVRA